MDNCDSHKVYVSNGLFQCSNFDCRGVQVLPQATFSRQCRWFMARKEQKGRCELHETTNSAVLDVYGLVLFVVKHKVYAGKVRNKQYPFAQATICVVYSSYAACDHCVKMFPL